MIPLLGVSAALVVPILLSPPLRVALHTEYSIFRQLEHALIFTLSMLSRRFESPWVACCSHQLIPSSFLCISQNTPPFPLIQDTPSNRSVSFAAGIVAGVYWSRSSSGLTASYRFFNYISSS